MGVKTGNPLYKALLKAGKICRFPECQLQAGHIVRWFTEKDKDGNEQKRAEVGQAKFCWYHGASRAAQKKKGKAYA